MNEQEKLLKVYKASAGAGKTFRLAVEYIALLVKNPNEYQHILAVTFTNKATGEMKQRILSQLYGIANELESSKGYVKEIVKLLKSEGMPNCTDLLVKEQCSKALSMIVHDYSSFRIVTIDSFFQSIVRELATEMNLPANISAELNSDAALKKAIDEIIDNVSLASPEFDSMTRFIESRIEEGKTWKIDDSLNEFGKTILKESYLIHDDAIKQTISSKTNLQKYRKNIFKYRDLICDNIQKRIDLLIENGREACNSNLGKQMSKKPCKLFTNEETDWSKKDSFTDTQKGYALDASSWLTKSTKQREECTELVTSILMPTLSALIELVEQRNQLKNNVDAVTRHLYNLMIIGKIDEHLDELNKENNRFLLAETAHFLKEVINNSNLPFIYEKTGTQINHIMIDEFQDTSTLQWENFKPLLANSLDSHNSCLIVGDVKQSIYRFRNSDWKTLNNIDKEGSELFNSIMPIKHDTNHRSAPNVIRFNNSFFKRAIEIINEKYQQDHGTECEELSVAYKDVAQKPENEKDEYGYVKVQQFIHSNDEDKEEKKEKELYCILKNVKELKDKNVADEDIAILVRTRAEAVEICEYFEQHKDEVNVKIISDEAFKLDASAAINMLIFSLRALSSFNDKLHLATLAYYYQTLVLQNEQVANDLTQVFLANEETLLNDYLPKAFKDKRTELRYKSIAEIVEDVYEMFNLKQIKGQDAYMFCFHDIVESYCNDNIADIDNFLKQWDEDLHEKTIPNGNTNGIRLMTIHKSKGLEFHSVIIPFCNWKLTPKDDTILWCEPNVEPYNEMPLMPVKYSDTKKSDIFTKEHDEEELMTLVDNINVLYVGFTRAVQNLIIIACPKYKDSNNKDDKSKNKEEIDKVDDTSSKTINGEYTIDKLIVKSIEAAIIKDNDKNNENGIASENHDTQEMDAQFELTSIAKEEDGIIEFTKGEIVGHDGPNIEKKKKKEDKKVNPLTRHFEETPVEFVSNQTMAEFRQSNNSDLFISEKSNNEMAQKRANRIRLISLGNLYHNILQLINTKLDVHHAVLQMEKRGCFEQLANKNEVEDYINKLIDKVSESHPEWFSGEWKTINERAILFKQEGSEELCTKRPDKVIVKDNCAIVIDYKTAENVIRTDSDGNVKVPAENREQVELYCNLMKQMGYDNVKGYLWYLLEDVVYPIDVESLS